MMIEIKTVFNFAIIAFTIPVTLAYTMYKLVMATYLPFTNWEQNYYVHGWK